MKEMRELVDERRRRHCMLAKLNLFWHDTLAHMIGFSIIVLGILAPINFLFPTSQRILNIIILVFSTLALLGETINLRMRFSERFRFYKLREASYSSFIERLKQNLFKPEDAIREYENIIRGDAELPLQ